MTKAAFIAGFAGRDNSRPVESSRASAWVESQTLELKASFGEWKEIIQCLCAFANAQGGKVVVGVDDAGQPTGIEIGKSTIEDFLNKVRLNTDPVLYPSVTVRTFGPSEIVEILVEESQSKPVFAFARAFMRVGRTTQRLSALAIKEMARASLPGDFDTRFTKIALKGWEIDERAEKRLDFGKLSKDDRLVRGGKISTGLYLAGCKRNRLHEQAVVKAGLFKGVTTSRFLDMKEFDGSLLFLVEETMEFVARHLSMAVVLDGAPQRKEVWEIPMAAVREAVVNAVLHRDYDDPGNVQVRIFDDRLEVWSPGLLVGTRDLASLGQEVRSVPRNRNLVRLARELGLVEAWGTGFQRMTEECRDRNLPLPEWRHKDGAFVTTFLKKESQPEGVNEGVNKGVNEGVNEGVNSSRLLDLIRKESGLRARQLSSRLEASPKSVERWLAQLRSKNLVEFRGAPKTGGYFAVGVRS